jgi:hypothetical protein
MSKMPKTHGHLALLLLILYTLSVRSDPSVRDDDEDEYNNNNNDLNPVKTDHVVVKYGIGPRIYRHVDASASNTLNSAASVPLPSSTSSETSSSSSNQRPFESTRSSLRTNTVKYSYSPANQHNYLKGEEKTCGSMVLKNTVNHLHKLENCTVIEGSLTINLMDYTTASDFASISFPDLVEITDYLLIYRVQGLQSLGRLFPNLAVIRGHKLFSDYALVVFDNASLLKLELKNLTSIERGAVRVEKNPNLCFADTVDWNLIAPPSKGTAISRNHVIRVSFELFNSLRLPIPKNSCCFRYTCLLVFVVIDRLS